MSKKSFSEKKIEEIREGFSPFSDLTDPMGQQMQKKEIEEGSQCDPCYEISPNNMCKFDVIDWDKCTFMKPCCRKVPHCGNYAKFALAVTFVGAMVGMFILW